MRGSPITVRGLLVVAGVMLLIFANTAAHAMAFQVGGVGLIVGAAALCIITGRVRLERLTLLDSVFFIVVLFSLTASVINQDAYISMYSLVFLATYAAIVVLVRTMSDDEIAFAITLSITLSVLFIFAVDGKDILTTLRPGAANRWALRLQPFGMTPDLGGYAFGGFIIALLFSNFSNVPVLRQAGWAAKTVLAGMSAMITLATMARGGFVAVVATLMIYVARNVAFHKRLRLYIIFGVGALVIGGGIYWSTIAAYMTEMLELDSSHRGIGSGGTGRLELWQRGIEFIFGRSWEVLIGSGLRSSDISYIGFFTESSYITLAIEMGVFASAFLVGCFLFLLYRTGKDEFRRNDAFGKMAFYCITYAMLQSIFNRYLIAIGNPFSLMFLIIVSRAFLNQANERRALARRRHTAFRTRATMQQEPAATSQRTALGR